MGGVEPIMRLRGMEPRFAFDNELLTRATWDGFRYFGPLDIKYASNGVWGIPLVEKLMEKYNSTGEVLSLLMTDSVFSAHLVYDNETQVYTVDVNGQAKYKPIPGYANLGGAATFVQDKNILRLKSLTYEGQTYTDFDDSSTAQAFKQSKRSGWRMAEGAFIATMLSETNLVMHVQKLHLEIAAAFNAITIDAFANEPKHPVRRLLDPYIHRSIQATNDNFKLLYLYHAGDFSLAPMNDSEQLKLLDDSIKSNPMNLADMDMERYGKLRHIDPDLSTHEAMEDSSRWGWRWHYRALTVQRLYDTYVDCWLKASYGNAGDLDAKLADDGVLQAWWSTMLDHLPSLTIATQLSPEWAGPGKVTAQSLRNVARTLMVWLSWIHEDVGHSAAAYVYNPVYTPMCVPKDGVGIPMESWLFNAAAYRGFVFLHRTSLLDDPPDFWFDGVEACRTCFTDFQQGLRRLGQEDKAFSECDTHGFYSCVDRVETAVSS